MLTRHRIGQPSHRIRLDMPYKEMSEWRRGPIPGSLRNSTGLMTVGFQWPLAVTNDLANLRIPMGRLLQAPLDFDGLLMIISAVRRAKRKGRRTKYNVNSKT